MRSVVTTVVELAALAAIVAGVIILWGVGWGLLAGGVLAAAVSVTSAVVRR